MSEPHPQADILRAIADGKTIECRHPQWNDGAWAINCSPLRIIEKKPPDWELRIKPETININGHEVPKPVREPLNYRGEYYIPNEREDPLYVKLIWLDDNIDKRLLARGLIHCTKDAAIAHAEALLSFTRSGK